MRYLGEVLLDKPGFGTRCMADEPLEWVTLTDLNIFFPDFPLCYFIWLHESISPTGRDFPCNNITTEWEMPLVNPALIDMLASPEWNNALRPSPDCQCSTAKKLTMLPECPEGAGGLPPPQVMVELLIRKIITKCTLCWILSTRSLSLTTLKFRDAPLLMIMLIFNTLCVILGIRGSSQQAMF